MENLWSDLSREANTPPDWHEDTLKSRENEWGQRGTLGQNWTEAKKELREELLG
jgi:hypothetical protein